MKAREEERSVSPMQHCLAASLPAPHDKFITLMSRSSLSSSPQSVANSTDQSTPVKLRQCDRGALNRHRHVLVHACEIFIDTQIHRL